MKTQAIILAAGKSTRTYPLTLTKPKPLLKVANKELLAHNLEQLQGIVDEAIIVVGYMKEQIIERFGESFKKIKIRYIEQKTQDGNGNAVLLCKEYIKDKFLVMNGDDLFSKKDIKKCVKHDYSVLGNKASDLSRFGEILLKDNAVSEIREKPGNKPGIANTGLYVFDKAVFSYELKKSPRGEYEITDFIKHLVDDNKRVDCETVEGYWLPITYPWNMLEANEALLSSTKTKIKGIVEKGVTIKGEVVVGEGTVVKSGAYIEGPVVIGENCIIGPNCYIRSSTTIGNKSKIGNAVEVKNSVIGDNTSIGHLSYVGDSVIGNNVNFGAGTITANLRHDDANVTSPVKGDLVDTGRRKIGGIVGDDVHTGINTSIYPGRKIWAGKTTLPGENVKKDIE